MVRNDPVVDDFEDAFVVVRNDAGQYSVWWEDRPAPAGWAVVGPPKTRAECLDQISLLWTDMRPAGVRARVGGGTP
jgi:MbtH protein